MRIPGPDPMARPGPGSSERRAPGRRVQRMQGVRTYSTMTPSLAGMADWLRGLGVTRVTRELDDRKRSRPVREGAVGKRTSTAGTSPDGLPHPSRPSSPHTPPTRASSTNPQPAPQSPKSRQTDEHHDSTTTNPAGPRPAGFPSTQRPSPPNMTPSSHPTWRPTVRSLRLHAHPPGGRGCGLGASRRARSQLDRPGDRTAKGTGPHPWPGAAPPGHRARAVAACGLTPSAPVAARPSTSTPVAAGES